MYGLVYTVLEVLALPAIPLTMTAGVIFGTIPGTMVVSVASTLAAAFSFLIARYLARDKVCDFFSMAGLCHAGTRPPSVNLSGCGPSSG